MNGHNATTGKRNPYEILVGKPLGKVRGPQRRGGHRGEHIKWMLEKLVVGVLTGPH
jgi:hypothetical protein